MNHEDTFETVDPAALAGVSGGNQLVARLVGWGSRAANAVTRAITGGEGFKGATMRAGQLAEAITGGVDGEVSRSVMRNRPSLQPSPPAITRFDPNPPGPPSIPGVSIPGAP